MFLFPASYMWRFSAFSYMMEYVYLLCMFSVCITCDISAGNWWGICSREIMWSICILILVDMKWNRPKNCCSDALSLRHGGCLLPQCFPPTCQQQVCLCVNVYSSNWTLCAAYVRTANNTCCSQRRNQVTLKDTDLLLKTRECGKTHCCPVWLSSQVFSLQNQVTRLRPLSGHSN